MFFFLKKKRMIKIPCKNKKYPSLSYIVIARYPGLHSEICLKIKIRKEKNKMEKKMSEIY